ncbi:MAG: thermonuclease family protein [Alphaproteobacteria bacterium]|nr:thermonuclease family protein [Alphaproteobacteria bacterium]
MAKSVNSPSATALRLLLLAALVLALAGQARAADAAEFALRAGGSGQAVEIVDGDTLVLESGEEVRLVGIQAPKLPLGRKGFRAWPLAEEAKAALAALALGKTLTLSYGGRRMDRHGRLLAHLHDAEGRWIQGELLARGMARVYSFADNRARVAEMLALERAARADGRGIWGTDPPVQAFYGIRAVTETPRFLNSFQLVAGRVRQVARVRGKTFLNFGEDWRSDFTIVIPAKARRLFDRAGVDPASYEGKRVRVRGWLKPFNGPMIAASHPEQIEVLDE